MGFHPPHAREQIRDFDHEKRPVSDDAPGFLDFSLGLTFRDKDRGYASK